MNKKYLESVEKCISWINKEMLTFDNGYYGIYERIRIDEHIRTNWSRPDCNCEYLRALYTYKEIVSCDCNDNLMKNILNWIIRTQDNNPLSVWKGSFPFYLIDGCIRENKVDSTIYQNDNGKIMVVMCQLYNEYKDKRFLEIAEGVAEYWAKTQRSDGTFGILDGKNMEPCAKGPCFLHWLVSGYYLLYQITKNEKYLNCAEKGMEYVISTIHQSGRSLTTYEILKMEDWRPVSSETSMALYTFCTAYIATDKEMYKDYINKTGGYILKLQDKCGAIMNCNDSCLDAALQNNMELCDLVYTEGFALQALILAYKCTSEKIYLATAIKLADFLVDIQCNGESPLWDGGWRGSFNVKTWKWDGRANQNNTIDEGGMYSVYTGWSSTNIIYGLQQLILLDK